MPIRGNRLTSSKLPFASSSSTVNRTSLRERALNRLFQLVRLWISFSHTSSLANLQLPAEVPRAFFPPLPSPLPAPFALPDTTPLHRGGTNAVGFTSRETIPTRRHSPLESKPLQTPKHTKNTRGISVFEEAREREREKEKLVEHVARCFRFSRAIHSALLSTQEGYILLLP